MIAPKRATDSPRWSEIDTASRTSRAEDQLDVNEDRPPRVFVATGTCPMSATVSGTRRSPEAMVCDPSVDIDPAVGDAGCRVIRRDLRTLMNGKMKPCRLATLTG